MRTSFITESSNNDVIDEFINKENAVSLRELLRRESQIKSVKDGNLT